MKQEIVGSTTPSRVRASPRVKESPRSETVNGVSPGLKARPRPIAAEAVNSQRVRRSLGLNKVKSNEEVLGSQRSREVEDVRIVGRSGNRPSLEQFARTRRHVDLGYKKNEDDIDERNKELQEKLEASENLVKDLRSEVAALKAQLLSFQALNLELVSQNKQYVESLAQARKPAPCRHDQKDLCQEETHAPIFKDVQKIIANKLENARVKSDSRVDTSSMRKPPTEEELRPIPKTAEMEPKVMSNMTVPPPPPPPPRPRGPGKAATKAPALVEFYHSLTKRDQVKKDSLGTANRSYPTVTNAHNSIVGEIQNRSSHLLAIKADIETRGEFIQSLIGKVQDAAYTNIEDVLRFVDWLDGELASLADERAVLRHFNWPEKKADAMREAAIEYRDLKRLENEVSSYKDDFSIPCETALKRIANLLDKSERSVEKLIRLRSSAMLSYKEYKVPTEWMLDSGMVSKIKKVSMKLAKMYIKRVSSEIESVRHSEREFTQEALVLQGVRFAYRVHQFAGGLDSETMSAFEDFRQRVPARELHHKT